MARARGTSPASSHTVDGRRARTARTRAAILDAVLALIRAGAIHPTAADIAAQAKVSLRSIAQHFPTRVALFASAAERHGARPEVALPDPAMPLARRLRAFAAARATDLESTRLLRASAAQFVADYPVVAAAIVGNAATRRAQLERTFPRELSALAADDRELLDVALCGRMWDALRERGNSPARSLALMTRLARRLLGVAPTVRGS
jgi:TetR/AcrR family transcriptional regulator of autoinduction and epiphytic fitness